MLQFETASRQLEEAEIFLGGEDGFCFFVEGGSGNAFDKELGDFFGSGGIDGAIES